MAVSLPDFPRFDAGSETISWQKWLTNLENLFVVLDKFVTKKDAIFTA